MNPDVERKIDEIRRDREHGAGWLSREAIATMELAAEKSETTNTYDFLRELEAIAHRLTEARPGMVAIMNLVSRFVCHLSDSSERNLDLLRGFARLMGDKLIRDSQGATWKAASLASGVIKDGDGVMSCTHSATICQVFSLAKDEGKRFHVVVAESRASKGRPYGEITARELRSLGISVEVIPDSSIDHHMPKMAKVIVGADTILRNGSLINGTPTFKVALAAKKASIPFYTVCETSKLDLLRRGRETQLEEGFDRVSPHLITGIITEGGILQPDQVVKHVGEWIRLIHSRESQAVNIDEQIRQAIETLKKGGIVAFPTDTVYGLGANALDNNAVAKVYRVKRRPRHLALPLTLGEVCQIAAVARDIPDIAWRLAEHFLPGALTLVLHKAASVSSVVSGGGERIAVRVPDHPVPIALVDGLGAPITGTSANLSGSPSLLTAEEVHRQMGDMVDLIIDGSCPGGVDSTVVDLTGEAPRILREGAISREEVERICGKEMHLKEESNADCYWLRP